MNCEEIKISLHDFVDETLDDFQRHEFEAHLRTCDKCFNDYKRTKKFFDKLKTLPYTIEPPADIIETFSNELLDRRLHEEESEAVPSTADLKKLRKEWEKQEKQIRKVRGERHKSSIYNTTTISRIPSTVLSQSINWGSVLWVALPIILLTAGYFIYDFQKYNSPWKVITNSGTVVINGLLNHSGIISQGESLLTNESSKATLYVPKIGSVRVEQNSLLILAKTKDGNNKIQLKDGAINIINTSTMPDLLIELKYCTVIDRGGQFSVFVDIQENAKITVRYGFVEVKNGNGTINLVEEYSCEIRRGLGIGTPYREKASAAFKDEVKNFDFGNRNSTEKIIELAETNDALTLLGMIPKVDISGRELLFQAASSRFRPPDGVTREGILNADEKMIYLWWQEIEWQL